MVELDDEMLLDMNSPMKQSPAARSPTSETVIRVEQENFLDELNYNETQANPHGFFADADDQVSFCSI